MRGRRVLGGGGAVTLVAALVTGLMGNARDQELQRVSRTMCPQRECGLLAPNQRLQLARVNSEMKTYYTVTNVLLGIGGVSLAAAGVWYLLSPRAHDRDEGEVAVLPYVASGGVGGYVRLVF